MLWLWELCLATSALKVLLLSLLIFSPTESIKHQGTACLYRLFKEHMWACCLSKCFTSLPSLPEKIKMSLRKQTPSDFLKQIIGRPVVVKLNSGVDYRGKFSICLSHRVKSLFGETGTDALLLKSKTVWSRILEYGNIDLRMVTLKIENQLWRNWWKG